MPPRARLGYAEEKLGSCHAWQSCTSSIRDYRRDDDRGVCDVGRQEPLGRAERRSGRRLLVLLNDRALRRGPIAPCARLTSTGIPPTFTIRWWEEKKRPI